MTIPQLIEVCSKFQSFIGDAWFTFLVCYFCLNSLSEQFLDTGVVWVVKEEEKGKSLFCQLLGMVGGRGRGREGGKKRREEGKERRWLRRKKSGKQQCGSDQ